MSVIIEIQGTPIEFPSTGESPNWAPAVIQFAQSVETALSLVVNIDDVPSQSLNLTLENILIPRDITNLLFSPSRVRSANIDYSLYFVDNSSVVQTESGTLTLLYSGSWSISREFFGEVVVGGSLTTFTVTPAGQVQIQVNDLASYTQATISFSAKTLPQD
jgi:hypothetical protein